MKKILLLSLTVILFVSCKATHSISAQNKLKGDWQVENVTYSENDINVKAFGLISAKCFEGSVWNFVPNNQTGNLKSISNGTCSLQESDFKWYITPENQFGLKFMQDNVKAKEVLKGYLFDINMQTEDSFTLTQNVNFEGETIKIKYQFTKK